jgi:hypothetical protein
MTSQGSAVPWPNPLLAPVVKSTVLALPQMACTLLQHSSWLRFFGLASLAFANTITCAEASIAILAAQVVCSTIQLRVGPRETQFAGNKNTCQVPSQRVICEGLLQGVQSQEETRKHHANMQAPLLSNAITFSDSPNSERHRAPCMLCCRRTARV